MILVKPLVSEASWQADQLAGAPTEKFFQAVHSMAASSL